MTSTTITDRAGLYSTLAIKSPVSAITTANRALSGLTATSITFAAGVSALSETTRVLVRSQTDSTENGVYVSSSGTWTRARDFDGPRDIVNGSLVVFPGISGGNAALYQVSTEDSPVVGTSTITFELQDDPNVDIPQTQIEINAGITPSNTAYRVGSPRRYGATGAGVADDTAAVAKAVAIGLLIIERGDTYLTFTQVPDCANFMVINEGGWLKAKSTIPAGGFIIASLAGGADAATNQAILDGIYGASVVSVRTVVTGTAENWHIDGINFISNANAIGAIWAVGLGRGSTVSRNSCPGFTGVVIALNGCFGPLDVRSNNCVGNGTDGTGIQLGKVGFGKRSNSVVCNEVSVIANVCRSQQDGIVWDFGSGGVLLVNDVEDNARNGMSMQSLDAVLISGNDAENNATANFDIGGTNGSDKCTALTFSSNNSAQSVGDHVRVNGATDSHFYPGKFSGSVTQWYRFDTDADTNVSNCYFWVPARSATYITAPTELLVTTNFFDESVEMRKHVPYLSVHGSIRLGGDTGPVESFGTGSPEGVVTAVIGSSYHRTDGGANTCLYIKESGASNTGWVAK